jgi:hypothetical protein
VPVQVDATRRHRSKAWRTNSIRPGVDGSVPPQKNSVSKIVASNGSVATLTPIELRIRPPVSDQHTYVVDRLTHLLVREFEDGERSEAHHLKAGGEDETDTLHGRLTRLTGSRRTLESRGHALLSPVTKLSKNGD